MIKLLRPEHPRQGLALHVARVRGKTLGNDLRIEFIGLRNPLIEGRLKLLVQQIRGGLLRCEAQAKHRPLAGRNIQPIIRGGLGARLRRIHRAGLAVNQVFVDPVLYKRRSIRRAVEPLAIGLVLSEEQLRRALADQPSLAVVIVNRLDGRHLREPTLTRQCGARRVPGPCPGVAEPERRQQVQLRAFRTAIIGVMRIRMSSGAALA